MVNLLTEQHIKESFVDNLEMIMDNSFKSKQRILDNNDKAAMKYISYINNKLVNNSKDEISRFVAFINECILSGDTISLYGNERRDFDWVDIKMYVNIGENSEYKTYDKNNFNPQDFVVNLVKNMLYIDKVDLGTSFLDSESVHNYNKEQLLRHNLLAKKDLERKNFGLPLTSMSRELPNANYVLNIYEGFQSFEDEVVNKWSIEEINEFKENKIDIYENIYSIQKEVLYGTSKDYININKAFENIERIDSRNVLVTVAEMLWNFNGSVKNDPALSEDLNKNGILFLLNQSHSIDQSNIIGEKLKPTFFKILNHFAEINPQLILKHFNNNDTYLWNKKNAKDLDVIIKTLANNKKLVIKKDFYTKFESAIVQERKLNEVDDMPLQNEGDLVENLFFRKKIVKYEISESDLMVFLRHQNHLSNAFFDLKDWVESVNIVFKEIGVTVELKSPNISIEINEQRNEQDAKMEDIYFQLLGDSVEIFNNIDINENPENFSINMRAHIREAFLNRKLESEDLKKTISRKKV